MTKDHEDDRRAGVRRAAGTLLLIALVSLTLHFAPVPAIDLPSIPLPDLPDWVGPAFRVGRWVVLAVVVVLVFVGAMEDEARDRDRDGGAS